MRQASVIAADEATYSVSGKINIFGIYVTDLSIPTDPTFASQLVFIFFIETEPDDPFQKLELHVELPGGDMRHVPLFIPNLRPGMADSIRWSLKYPLFFQNPILRPGAVIATVIHEKGILSPAAPYIVLREPPGIAPQTKQ